MRNPTQMSNKIIAIHQPNFLPWLGYFNKIFMSDFFVILDDVQFPKASKGNWINRHLLNDCGEAIWATIPIDRRFSGTRKISEIQLSNHTEWKVEYLTKIKHLYSGSPFFGEIFSFLSDCMQHTSSNLCKNNLFFLYSVLAQMGCNTDKIVLSSTLRTRGSSNLLLCSIVEILGGSTYLCGNGSSGYLDLDVFTQQQIEVKFQNFREKPYSQFRNSSFVNGLSIVDVLMNLGFQETRKLITI